ncbi:hypothetical protein TNIN_501002 [Trichonephila inaurata madagascariensis]|uniref:RING-type domain-containing protein n=1 Tax=Trichonephila inaurata madagascariensis TaxID=2747483 RepID=A0A8X6X060_9ARAC|nr:hypothetical protein TNIN_501002 [Trichonephila inaurata madagascariensis]
MLTTQDFGGFNKISCDGNIKFTPCLCQKFIKFFNKFWEVPEKLVKMVSEISPRYTTDMAIKKYIPDDVIDERLEKIKDIDEIDNPSYLSLERYVSDENARNKELFEVMKYELNRFNSFTDRWPLTYVNPKELAENGFFYLQSEDQVQCAFCGIVIDDWNVGDKPLKEHMKKAPKCPFLLTVNVGNVPMNKSKPQGPKLNKYVQNINPNISSFNKPRRPQMSDLKSRLLTYKGWPLIMLSSKQLAECGFYYSGVLDVVTCFYCNGSLGNWEINDDPMIEHEKFFPHCGYLDFIKSQMKSVSNKSLIASPGINQVHSPPDVTQINRIESIENEVLRQACEIFPTLKVQKVAVEHLKSTGQHFKSLHDLCEAVLEYDKKQESNKLKSSPPVMVTKSVNITSESHNSTNVTETVKKDICKICMDEEMNVVFEPCYHLVSCHKCAEKIFDCPLCRTPVTHKMKVFRG